GRLGIGGGPLAWHEARPHHRPLALAGPFRPGRRSGTRTGGVRAARAVAPLAATLRVRFQRGQPRGPAPRDDPGGPADRRGPRLLRHPAPRRGMTEWLETMSANRRKDVRRAFKRLEAAGCQLRVVPPAGADRALEDLRRLQHAQFG